MFGGFNLSWTWFQNHQTHTDVVSWRYEWLLFPGENQMLGLTHTSDCVTDSLDSVADKGRFAKDLMMSIKSSTQPLSVPVNQWNVLSASTH